RAYKQSLSQLKGQRINWPAMVGSIDKKGVEVGCGGSDYIDPNATSTRAERYNMSVFVNADESHLQQYGHYHKKTDHTLALDKQIPLEFAKTLRSGDTI